MDAALIVPGSSPHSRGTRDRFNDVLDRARIIPAFAGNTHLSDLDKIQGRDHPRIRGEHRGKAPVEAEHQGSSPHSRGTRVQ